METQIRPVDVADAESVAALSAELGYPVSVAAMEERIRNYALLTDRVVFVACRDSIVIGWIDVGIVHHLQVESNGEIGGLVVSQTCRSSGIGAKLVSRAEEWVKERGLTRIIVRSQIAREAAHRFYLRGGYERTKTSAVFSKSLAAASVAGQS
jgi:GNAT superfamily N-acetyltransferase